MHVKYKLMKKFEMTNLCYLHYFPILQVLQTKEGISLSQSKYAYDLIHLFHMEDCELVPFPFQFALKLSAICTTLEVDTSLDYQLVGSLLYLTHTCIYISFVVGLVAQYM
jgi:hypothetical protein